MSIEKTINNVNAVDAKSPNMSVHASPEKIGSKVIGHALRAVVAAVRRMGLIRMTPLCRMASLNGVPALIAS